MSNLGSTSRQASFDPVRLGQRECAAWAAYYRHEWASFLRSAVGMVATGFGMSRANTLAGAWYVLQANRAWAPVPDNDPDSARAYMGRFYTVVRDSGWGNLDPTRAAALEVEWWRLHRAHQREGADADALLESLDALYSYVYDVPPSTPARHLPCATRLAYVSRRWISPMRGLRPDVISPIRCLPRSGGLSLRRIPRSVTQSSAGSLRRPPRASRVRRSAEALDQHRHALTAADAHRLQPDRRVVKAQ